MEQKDPLPSGRITHPGATRVSGADIPRFKLLRGETAAQHFPAEAKAAKLKGTVKVDLLLNDMGQVLEAQVISEAPKGKGFGLAALDAAKTFEFENPLHKMVLLSMDVEFTP